METQTAQNEPAKKTNKKGNDLARHLGALKVEFAKVGNLLTKLSLANSATEKSDVKNKHAFDMNRIKKAIKVFKTEVLNSEDLDTYKKLLTFERQRNIINVPDEYALNKMEADTLEENCECFTAPPSGLRVTLGGKYKYLSYFDEATQKEMFITYIPVVIPPESQIDADLEWKISQGFMPTKEDYGTAKTIWKRRLLVDTQWHKYFREI